MDILLNAMYQPAEHLPALSRAAEEMGYAGLTFGDHLLQPVEAMQSLHPITGDNPAFRAAFRSSDWPDNWVTIGALSQLTSRLVFATHVHVLPLRDPIAAARAIVTAANFSHGRVLVGVGIGWMREEYALNDSLWAERGRRIEEQVRIMRQLWTGLPTQFEGEFYRFGPAVMEPAAQEPIPVLFGGASDRSFDRAARIGDGYVAMNQDYDGLVKEVMPRLRRALDQHGRSSEGFLAHAFYPGLARFGEDAWSDLDLVRLDELRSLGVSSVDVRPLPVERVLNASLDEKLAEYERFAARFVRGSR